ncbi:hypothetical protein PG994_013022 [Apiospora phragmitis]|uniref:Uncharacterized protein n=1 Tax=Apiospora phragmitis TaxID=2905665 RepID=A0ABR1T7G7_9PEZI
MDMTKSTSAAQLAVEKVSEDSQLVLLGILTRDDATLAYCEEQSHKWLAGLEAWSRQRGTYVDWLYLNYAHGEQDPLGAIGEANRALIQDVSQKYDPSGFKISKSKA